MRQLGVRRTAFAVALIAAAVLAGVLSPGLASATPTGTLWGAYPAARSTETDQDAVLRTERDAGRKLAVVRDYLLWDTPFPDVFHTWLADTGRTMILSVRAARVNRTLIPWADIAAAQPGDPLYADMVRWADALKALGVPVYFSFNHEPETAANTSIGTSAEFIAAWRKFRDVILDEGATNVRFMWIMTDYAFMASRTDRRYAPNWYPGDSEVDAIGADAYNWFTCRPAYQSPWKSLEAIIAKFREFGASHPDEEVWLPEFASVEDPAQPGRKAQWIADAQQLFKSAPYAQFQGVLYFDSAKNKDCQWPVDTSQTSLNAFAIMGADPFYGGSGMPPPPSHVSFVASANRHGLQANHTVPIPSTVRAGDTLLLYFASGQNAATTPPPGWNLVEGVDPDGIRGRVWSRTAVAGDAGSTVTVKSSISTKGDLTVAAYRGTSADPLDVSAVGVQTTTTASHPAPSVTPSQPDDWIAVYWADRSSSNTSHAIPGSLTRRLTSTGSGTGHITSTLADTAGAVPQSATPEYTATGTATSSRAVMFTLALSAD